MDEDYVTTWRELLRDEMLDQCDPGPVVAYAPDEAAFDIRFYRSVGAWEGPKVFAWTETRVYFPLAVEGSVWVVSVPRDPQAAGQRHLGGE